MSEVIKVEDRGLVAALHLPTVTDRRPGVIVLGGSTGGLASANLYGEPLAAAGFVTLCLAYFAMDGLPTDLSLIPLEYFNQAIQWLQVHPAVDGERLGVFGSSRGGEAALVIGASFPAIKAVVANVPSHVVWQGANADLSQKTSSWTLGGVGLPFVSLVSPRVGTVWCEWFEASLRDPSVPVEAAIPVERINGPILFVSGAADGVWPASAMVDRAIDRLRRHRFPFEIEHARYEEAGHAFLVPPYLVGPVANPWPPESYRQPQWMLSGLPPLTMGGTVDGNRLASMDAWLRTVAFLRRNLG